MKENNTTCYIKVNTPVGVFASDYLVYSNEDIKNGEDSIKANISELSYLELITSNSKIIIPGELLRNSVIQFVYGGKE